MIEDLFNTTVKVQRLAPVEDTDREEYADHIIGLGCHIQPLDDSYSQDMEGSFGKDKLLFCDVVDILEGDRIIDTETSIEYKVVGVESFNFLDMPRHMEVRIREFNE